MRGYGLLQHVQYQTIPTQTEVANIIRESPIDRLANNMEEAYSVEVVHSNQQFILRLQDQYKLSRLLQFGPINDRGVCLSILQVVVAQQARRAGLREAKHEEWLHMAFTHLTSVESSSQWHEISFKCVLLIFDYFGRQEEKVVHLLKSIQLIRNRKLLLQTLCSSILKASFRIQHCNAFREYLATHKDLKHCQSMYLQQFYRKGLSQAQEDAVLKFSLLTYTLSAALSFQGSVKQIRVVRMTLFEHQARQMVSMLKLLTSIGVSIFGKSIGDSILDVSMAKPFRKLIEAFKEVASQYRLFACPKAIICQTMMTNIMIMGGIQIPKSGAEENQAILQRKIEMIKQQDEGLLLPFLSQQYARRYMDSQGRGQARVDDYIAHFRQDLFEGEDILIEYISLYFQQGEDYPIRNMQFLFHKLHLLIACNFQLQGMIRMCIYYLVISHRLNRPNKQGIKALRAALPSVSSQVHSPPQEKLLTMSIAAALGLNPTISQKAMVGNLIESIADVDSQIACYLQSEYLKGKPHAEQLSRKFGKICSFYYYLFECGEKGMLETIRQNLLGPSDLYDLIQQHKMIIGLITPHQNSLMNGSGPHYERQFQEYRTKMDKLLRKSKLSTESMQMVMRNLNEAFKQAQTSDDSERAIRRLGKKSIGLLKCGLLIQYCLASLKDFLAPLNRQRILRIDYQTHSQRIIRKVIHIIGADETTSTRLLAS